MCSSYYTLQGKNSGTCTWQLAVKGENQLNYHLSIWIVPSKITRAILSCSIDKEEWKSMEIKLLEFWTQYPYGIKNTYRIWCLLSKQNWCENLILNWIIVNYDTALQKQEPAATGLVWNFSCSDHSGLWHWLADWKKSMTQVVGEEGNLSILKWNYLIFFHLLLNPAEGIKEVQYQTSLIWRKN